MTNKDRPRAWMPMYWGDYIQDTAHLSAAEHGAYLLLIAHYWAVGGPIPNDDDQLRRVSRMTARQWKQSRDIVMSFFGYAQDGLTVTHKRIDDELRRTAGITEERRKSGEKGAEARWQTHGKRHSKPMANAIDLPMANAWQNDAQPQSQSQPPTQKKDSEANASGALAVADDRTKLFNGSLVELGRLAGKEPNKLRPLVGRWLKLCNDDAGVLVDAIAAAAERRVADPVAWIEAGMKARAGPRNGAPDLSNTNLQIFLRSLAKI